MNRLEVGSFSVLFYFDVKNISNISSIDLNYGSLFDLKNIPTLFIFLSSINKLNNKLEEFQESEREEKERKERRERREENNNENVEEKNESNEENNEEKSSNKMKNIQSELCYNLSPSKNIKEALKLSKIDSQTKDIAIVVLTSHLNQIESLLSSIEGEEKDPSFVDTLLTEEKKEYFIKFMKLTQDELSISNFEDCIAMKLAVKNYCS